MNKNVSLIGFIFVSLFMSSCYTTKIAHGNLTIDSPVVKIISKKNHSLIEGLVPLGGGYQAKKYVGERVNYVTKSQRTFVDGLLRVITLGIYTPTTVTFYVPISDVGNK